MTQVIFSDADILLINKPAGISVLPEGWDRDANYLIKELGKTFNKIWTVHRIDKLTSGIILFALNAEAHRSLNIQFEKRQVEKKYHALVNGNPTWDEKITKFPLRVNVGHKHRTVVDERNGVSAETKFVVKERYPAATLVEATPMTGRTHQIRVHAFALGHPLVGDVLYNAPESRVIQRPALHARSLIFTHPATGNKVSFEADYPNDFREAVETLRKLLRKR